MNTQFEEGTRTASPEASGSPTRPEKHQPASPTRRALLKRAAWVVPAVVAFGPIPSMASKQSTGGGDGYPRPDRMPPDEIPKPRRKPRPR